MPDLSRRTSGLLLVFVVTLLVAAPLAGGLVGTGLSVGGPIDGAIGGSASPAVTPTDVDESDVERAVYANVSAMRSDAGSPPSTYDQQLAPIAGYHSEDMAEQDYVGAVSPTGETVADRFDRFEYACEHLGQIQQRLSVDQFVASEDGLETDLARSIVGNWRQSEEHETFLLRDENDRFGVGVTVDEDGFAYVSLVTCGR